MLSYSIEATRYLNKCHSRGIFMEGSTNVHDSGKPYNSQHQHAHIATPKFKEYDSLNDDYVAKPGGANNMLVGRGKI